MGQEKFWYVLLAAYESEDRMRLCVVCVLDLVLCA
jgi:hypothetical protein